jgi:hypothetical protein
MIPETLLEVHTHNGPDYKPLVDYASWRVALMNYTSELEPGRIARMQKHTDTDEVFVLLAGRCILFIGEGTDEVTQIHAVDMLPHRIYNVKRNCWHSHTFSPDARVLIVENRDTVDANSPFASLTAAQQSRLLQLYYNLWSAETSAGS